MTNAAQTGTEVSRLHAGTWVTKSLMLSVTIVWILQATFDAPGSLVRQLQFGASSSALVFDGQLERLITANWLHGFFIHFAINMVGLYLIGTPTERLLGSARMFVIYVVACIGGAAASVSMHHPAPAVGASTGVVGLFGSIGYLLFRFPAELPAPLRSAKKQWLFFFALNVGMGVAAEALDVVNLDHAGHLGGLAAGTLATVALTVRWPPMANSPARSKLTRAVALALLGLVVAGLATSAGRARASRPAKLALPAVHHPGAPAHLLNEVAFYLAIDPEASLADLQAAHHAAGRALQQHTMDQPPEDGDANRLRRAVEDTLATVEYRLHRHDEAVATQRPVFEQEPNAIYGSQFARFLAARLDRDGPIVAPPGQVPIELETQPAKNGVHIRVKTLGAAPAALRYYGIVRDRSGLLRGLVTERVEPGAEHQAWLVHKSWPENAQVELALVDTTPGPQPLGPELRWEDMDPEVSTYP